MIYINEQKPLMSTSLGPMVVVGCKLGIGRLVDESTFKSFKSQMLTLLHLN